MVTKSCCTCVVGAVSELLVLVAKYFFSMLWSKGVAGADGVRLAQNESDPHLFFGGGGSRRVSFGGCGSDVRCLATTGMEGVLGASGCFFVVIATL